MKRNVIASLLFACAIILTAASRGHSHGSEASSDKTKKAPSPPVEIKDPIISMMMASSIVAAGRLVNPRFSFPQTEKPPETEKPAESPKPAATKPPADPFAGAESAPG